MFLISSLTSSQLLHKKVIGTCILTLHSETLIKLLISSGSLSILLDFLFREIWEGDDRGSDGWMASSTRWTWVWAISGVGDRQGSLGCCSPWGPKEMDTNEWLNWTDTISEDLLFSFPICKYFISLSCHI